MNVKVKKGENCLCQRGKKYLFLMQQNTSIKMKNTKINKIYYFNVGYFDKLLTRIL